MRSAAGPNNKITQGPHLDSLAVDYSARPDRNIYAPEDMTITESRVAGACGNLLRGKGKTGVHTFCHLESYKVRVDQRVKKGQVIGVMGYTGYTTPIGPLGRHLHWYIETPRGYVYPPNLITEEVDIYKGKTAKEWNAHAIRLHKARDSLRAKVAELRAVIDKLNSKEKVYKADLQAAVDKMSKLTSDLEQTEQELDAAKEELEKKPVDNSNALQRLIDGAAELVQVIINKLTGGTKQ